ncbi:MAG TPA: hypothetical protein DCZ98_00995 [Cryomorphaceae bacterium]|nr:hypothetical protein [Cryomorphaceae bacterium]
MKECYSLKYTEFPNDTLSLIYEDHLIRQYWPQLNKAQKGQSLKFGLYAFENGRGEVKWVIQKVIGSGALRKFGSYLTGQQWLSGFLDLMRREDLSDSDALDRITSSNLKKLIIPLEPALGAIFMEKGTITGIYLSNDYRHNEEWVRDHFITVSPSPTINAIGIKLAEEAPDQIISI